MKKILIFIICIIIVALLIYLNGMSSSGINIIEEKVKFSHPNGFDYLVTVPQISSEAKDNAAFNAKVFSIYTEYINNIEDIEKKEKAFNNIITYTVNQNKSECSITITCEYGDYNDKQKVFYDKIANVTRS